MLTLHVFDLGSSCLMFQTPAAGDGEPDGAGGALPAEKAEGGGGHQEERSSSDKSQCGAKENSSKTNPFFHDKCL